MLRSMSSNHSASGLQKQLSLRELALLTNATCVGDEHYMISGVADLESATPSDVSFLANARYQQALLKSKAGVIFVDPTTPLEPGRQYLVHPSPSLAFQQVVEAFYEALKNEITGFTGIHPTAVIHETAKLGQGVTVGPHAVIDKNAVIGDNTVISAGSFVGMGVKLGAECLIYPHVVIRERCILGNRVIIQPGVIVGSCGFGYATNAKGEHQKLHQLGYVHVEDDVEVGANTTIDRARFQVTRIKKGTKIDNLVQIAHGVILGEHNIIVAQSGIAGSTTTGRHVIVGGQVAIDGHLHIADGAMLAARSAVSKSLPAGKFSGAPAQPLHDFNRMTVYLRQIEKYVKEIKDLQSRLKALEDKSPSS